MKKAYSLFLTIIVLFFIYSCSGGGGTSSSTTTTPTSGSNENVTSPESIVKNITTSSIIQDNCNIQIKAFAQDNTSAPVKNANLTLTINKNGSEKSFVKTTDDTGNVTFNVNVCTMNISSINFKPSALNRLTYAISPKGNNEVKVESKTPIPLNNDGTVDLTKIVSKYEIKVDKTSETSVTFLILPYNKFNQLIKSQELNFNILINNNKINIIKKSDNEGKIFYTYILNNDTDLTVKIEPETKYVIYSSNSVVIPVKNGKINESAISDKIVISYDTKTLPDNTTITILSLNKFNAPVKNTSIYVKASCGIISSDNILTNDEGKAKILFENFQCDKSAKLTLTANSGVSYSYVIPLTSETELKPANFIILSGPNNAEITSDNKTLEYSLLLMDKDNNPVSGALVSLNSSCGKLSTNNVFSDDTGKIKFNFYPDESCLFGDNITILLTTENNLTKNINLHLMSNISKLNFQLSKNSVLFGVNDNLSITIFAVKQDHTPAYNELIKVTTNCGILYSNKLVTDEKGEAILQMNSLCDNDSYDKLSLSFYNGEGNQYSIDIPISYENVVNSISVSSSKLSVVANGADSSLITVFALNKNNGPVSGVTLNIGTSIGFVSTTNLETDATGKAQFTFSAGNYRGNSNAIISITATKFNKILTDNISIEIRGITLSATTDKKFIKADGQDFANVIVYVKDPSNNPEKDFPVTVYIDENNKDKADIKYNGDWIDNDNFTQNTDINGKIEFQLYGSQPGTVKLYIEAGGEKKEIDFILSNEVFTIKEIDNSSIDNINNIEIKKFHLIHFVWKDETGKGVNDNITFATSLGFFAKYSNNSCDNSGDNKSFIITEVKDGDAYVCYRSNYVGETVITATSGEKSTSFSILNISKNDVNKIILNASRSIIPYSTDTIKNTSTIIALVLDKDNNPLANKLVSFSLLNTSGSGENIYPVTAYTDASGRAYTTFTSGKEAVDNLTVKVEVDNVTSYIYLTVAGKAVNITIGKGNKIFSEDEETIYKKPLTVLVTDSTGNPINGAIVSLKVYPISYTTGHTVIAKDEKGNEYLLIIDNMTYQNEDVNFNNILDEGEDVNGNGKLDPTNPVALSPGNEIKTDEDGFKVFYLKYAKCYAHWLKVRVVATADVNGSKSEAQLEMSLPYSQADYEELTVPCDSPYGP